MESAIATVFCWNSQVRGAGGKPTALAPPGPEAGWAGTRPTARGGPAARGGGLGKDGIRDDTGGAQAGGASGGGGNGPADWNPPTGSGVGGANGEGGGTGGPIGATTGTVPETGGSAALEFSGDGLATPAGGGVALTTDWPQDRQNRAF